MTPKDRSGFEEQLALLIGVTAKHADGKAGRESDRRKRGLAAFQPILVLQWQQPLAGVGLGGLDGPEYFGKKRASLPNGGLGTRLCVERNRIWDRARLACQRALVPVEAGVEPQRSKNLFIDNCVCHGLAVDVPFRSSHCRAARTAPVLRYD